MHLRWYNNGSNSMSRHGGGIGDGDGVAVIGNPIERRKKGVAGMIEEKLKEGVLVLGDEGWKLSQTYIGNRFAVD